MVQHKYYVKANRNDWHYPEGSHNPTDWENLPLGEEQDFATFTRITQQWKSMRSGDIVIGHCSFQSVETKRGKKVVPQARIAAIGLVVDGPHYSNDLQTEAVTIKKVVGLKRPILLTAELIKKNNLEEAPPFKAGSNRCTITRLNETEYERILALIFQENPEAKKSIPQ